MSERPELPKAHTADEALALFNPYYQIGEQEGRWVDLWASRNAPPFGRQVARMIRTADRDLVQALVIGHQGSGKTTELRRTARALEKDHFVSWIDAEQSLEPEDIQMEDLLLVLMEGILRAAEKHRLRLPEGDLKLFDAWGSVQTATRVQSVATEGELSAGVDSASKPTLLGIALGIVGGMVARLKLGTDHRNEVRKEVGPRLADLLAVTERLSKAAMSAAREAHRTLVLIVDGLDRMRFEPGPEAGATSYEQLLVLCAPQIQRVCTHLLIVAPIGLSVQGRADNAWQILHIPNTQVENRSGDLIERNLDTLLEVIRRRAVVDALFADGETTARRVAALSGGNVRDLLRLVHSAALLTGNDKLTVDDIDHAARSYGSDLWARTRDMEEKEFLKKLRRGSIDVDAQPMVQRLLQLGILLNYRNSEHWAAVHPCVRLVRGFDQAERAR